MFYKVIYNNIIIDILKDPTWVLWLKNARRFIMSDAVTANGVISSDKQSVYNLFHRGVFQGSDEQHKVVSMVEIDESEYSFLKAQISDKPLDANGNVITLSAARTKKIEELSSACEENIVKGFDIILSDEISHHFTLDVYDQMRISNLNSKASAGSEKLLYHADGEICQYFSKEDIIAINEKMEQTIEYHTAYFNSMKVYISNIFNVGTILNIRYGDSIPTKYRTDVFADIASM